MFVYELSGCGFESRCSYKKPMESLAFQNFLKGPENDLTLRTKLISNLLQIFHNYNHHANAIQLTFTCSKSTIETSEKGVKYVQS